ncbi:hypothetical protein FOL46_007911 [Perkinsus olseni]|uniref:Uncharacterized protein n=1 Tax=Perkinsus olseni TaxID=32597 RepID=A0A7J6LAD9_PEROL|nr:hypothetical protein FOL46_007911 [Perkinsus olseni]
MYSSGIPALLSLTAATHRGLHRLPEWDSYCRAVNGAASFCIRTQLLGDFCAFGNEECGSGTIPPYTTTPSTTQQPTTPESSTLPPASTTTTITVTTLPPNAWDDFCRGLNGPSSFCLSTTLLGSFCAFGNQPCASGDPSTITPEASTSSSTTATVSPSTTTATPSTTRTSTKPVSVSNTPTAMRPETQPVDFRPACDSFCEKLNGPASYCKDWSSFPVCQFGNQPCGSLVDCQLSTPIPTPAVLSTSPIPTARSRGCDEMCRDLNGAWSYCKSWATNPVCQGGNQPCDGLSCSATVGGDAAVREDCSSMCIRLSGPGSYCKVWKDPPTCQGGNQPCGVPHCD